jgi:ABC-2 type transport system permease protein
VSRDRIVTLIGKELREFRASPSAVIPVVLLIVVCTLLPFVLVYLLPHLTGASLTSDRMMQDALNVARARMPGLAGMDADTAAEAFLLQQFLLLFLILPIVGAVSLAAYSVVGEKQGRTLEPLLTTPLTTSELLVAKALASFLPALAAEAAGIGIYLAGIWLLGSPDVLRSLFTVRSAILVLILGPAAALAALQATIAVSSRVTDPRSAQQVAVMLVLPLILMLVGQVAGTIFLTTGWLLLLSLGVLAGWGLLVLLSVALFERETILTRWK